MLVYGMINRTKCDIKFMRQELQVCLGFYVMYILHFAIFD